MKGKIRFISIVLLIVFMIIMGSRVYAEIPGQPEPPGESEIPGEPEIPGQPEPPGEPEKPEEPGKSDRIPGFDIWPGTLGDKVEDIEGMYAVGSFSKTIDGKTYQFYCLAAGMDLHQGDTNLIGAYVSEIGENSTEYSGDIEEVYYDNDHGCDDGTPTSIAGLENVWSSDNQQRTARFDEGKRIPIEEYQDIMYIFSATDSNGKLIEYEEYIQWFIWNNRINKEHNGTNEHEFDKYKLEEAEAYRKFYETIHNEKGEDIYKDTVKDITNYDEVKIYGDGDEDGENKRYVVGPFKIQYLEKAEEYQYTNITSNLGNENGTSGIKGNRVDFNKITSMEFFNQKNEPIKNVNILRNKAEYDKDQEYVFPHSEEDFWVEIPYENNKDITGVFIKVNFSYIEECRADLYEYEGHTLNWTWEETSRISDKCKEFSWTEPDPERPGEEEEHKGWYMHDEVTLTLKKSESEVQPLLAAYKGSGERNIKTYTFEIGRKFNKRPDNPPGGSGDDDDGDEKKEIIKTTMELGGKVFLDEKTGKISAVNNVYDENKEDELLKGIEVTLYEYDEKTKESKLATLGQEYEEVRQFIIDENGNKTETETYKQIINRGPETRTNPTLTDENGKYIFKGLDPMKKYYVQFTYNGQIYTNVNYKANEDYTINSRATEGTNNRDSFNEKFREISAYPQNYKITGTNLYPDKMQNGYNIAFHYKEKNQGITIEDLQKEITDNIFAYIENSKITNNEKKASYPNVVQDIYPAIIGKYKDIDKDIWNKLQFIEDCKIKSYTGNEGIDNGIQRINLYPNKDRFVIYGEKTTIEDGKAPLTNMVRIIINENGTFGVEDYDVTYESIYPDQQNVNQGIKLRPTVDLALYKDVYQAKTTINGHEEIYKYNKRVSGGKPFEFEVGKPFGDFKGTEDHGRIVQNYNNEATVKLDDKELKVRYEDILPQESLTENGYAGGYELDEDERLHIYVTYKIALENQSPITASVTEIVDYFDKKYEFVEAYLGNDDGDKGISLTASDTSKYANTEKHSNEYKKKYIQIPENRLDNGERIYVYVVFEMTDMESLEEVARGNSKDLETTNLVEINGYQTHNSKSDTKTPGLIDIDSTPGNFTPDGYQKGVTLFEDDENPAPAFLMKKLEEDGTRTLNGTVFEDSTTNDGIDIVDTGTYRQGDGKLTSQDKNRIKHAKVELLENKNGQLELRATTYTDGNGNYTFDHYLPGTYIIRYTYGDTDDTVIKGKNGNAKSYNGQDFQSTIINKDMSYNFDNDELIMIRKDPYWYAEEGNERYSDAVDKYGKNAELGTRQHAINYSETIDNYKSRVLSSADDIKDGDTISDERRNLLNELERETYITAYTPEMVMEIEKTTKVTEFNEQKNGHEQGYTINNVDFGIVERPRSLVQILKEVDEVKIKTQEGTDYLINGNMNQFVNNSIPGVQAWKNKSTIANMKYKLPNKYRTEPYEKGSINITMDEELMRGATIEITYKITVQNLSEKDYVKGNYGTNFQKESFRVKTSANKIIDYVKNNLKLDTSINGNSNWKEIIAPSENTELVNNDERKTELLYRNKDGKLDVGFTRTVLKNYNSVGKTEVLKNQKLKDEEKTSMSILLTQVMTPSSDPDAFVYDNNLEITETSNTVGRKLHKIKQIGNLNPDGTSPTGDIPTGGTPPLGGTPVIPKEPTHGEGEKITVVPPTGRKEPIELIAILGVGMVILAGGIVLIKKYVIH